MRGQSKIEAKLVEMCRNMVGLQTTLSENSQQRDKAKFEAEKKLARARVRNSRKTGERS